MAGESVIIVDLTVALAAADMDIGCVGAGIGFEVGQEATFDFRVLLEVGPDGLPACDNRRRHGATGLEHQIAAGLDVQTALCRAAGGDVKRPAGVGGVVE